MEKGHTTTTPTYRSRLEERVVFFLVAVGVIALTYGVLYVFDVLPEKRSTDEVVDTSASVAVDERQGSNEHRVAEDAALVSPLPTAIIFDSLGGKEVRILNPETSSVAVLDAALLEGVVRHPDSADFANPGTIFLLGHSSYLPVVHNKNFQAFNEIQKLTWGDTIRLRSKDAEYVYRVDRVYEAKAGDADVAIEDGEAKLVLATCNTFATKDDRYIVEASIVEKRPI